VTEHKGYRKIYRQASS